MFNISAKKTLKEKLQTLDFSIFTDNYYVSYLKNYIKMYDIIIQRYEEIIKYAIKHNNGTDFSFLDYGGGTGILSLLAYFSGINEVYYLDIVSLRKENFDILCKFLMLEIKNSLVGSYDSLDKTQKFDFIANYDVLEHIDQPLKCFIKLSKHLNKNGIIYMHSGANNHSPISVYLNRLKHTSTEPFNKTSDSQNLRLKYIEENFTYLPNDIIKKLSFATRGMIFREIDFVVEYYLISGRIYKNINKSNCRSPKNGVWTEHLFDLFIFKRELTNFFQKVILKAGKFPIGKPVFEKAMYKQSKTFSFIYSVLRFLSILVAPVLNFLITILPLKCSLLISSSYIIIAKNE